MGDTAFDSLQASDFDEIISFLQQEIGEPDLKQSDRILKKPNTLSVKLSPVTAAKLAVANSPFTRFHTQKMGKHTLTEQDPQIATKALSNLLRAIRHTNLLTLIKTHGPQTLNYIESADLCFLANNILQLLEAILSQYREKPDLYLNDPLHFLNTCFFPICSRDNPLMGLSFMIRLRPLLPKISAIIKLVMPDEQHTSATDVPLADRVNDIINQFLPVFVEIETSTLDESVKNKDTFIQRLRTEFETSNSVSIQPSPSSVEFPNLASRLFARLKPRFTQEAHRTLKQAFDSKAEKEQEKCDELNAKMTKKKEAPRDLAAEIAVAAETVAAPALTEPQADTVDSVVDEALHIFEKITLLEATPALILEKIEGLLAKLTPVPSNEPTDWFPETLNALKERVTLLSSSSSPRSSSSRQSIHLQGPLPTDLSHEIQQFYYFTQNQKILSCLLKTNNELNTLKTEIDRVFENAEQTNEDLTSIRKKLDEASSRVKKLTEPLTQAKKINQRSLTQEQKTLLELAIKNGELSLQAIHTSLEKQEKTYQTKQAEVTLKSEITATQAEIDTLEHTFNEKMLALERKIVFTKTDPSTQETKKVVNRKLVNLEDYLSAKGEIQVLRSDLSNKLAHLESLTKKSPDVEKFKPYIEEKTQKLNPKKTLIDPMFQFKIQQATQARAKLCSEACSKLNAYLEERQVSSWQLRLFHCDTRIAFVKQLQQAFSDYGKVPSSTHKKALSTHLINAMTKYHPRLDYQKSLRYLAIEQANLLEKNYGFKNILKDIDTALYDRYQNQTARNTKTATP